MPRPTTTPPKRLLAILGASLVFLVSPALSRAQGSPAQNCEDADFNGVDYKFCRDFMNWRDARNVCRAFGMDLARIDSPQENDFASRAGSIFLPRWIGANDRQQEDTWFWSSGGDAFFSGTAPSGRAVGGQYNNFAAFEPVPDLGLLDCVNIRPFTAGLWLTTSCAELSTFLCERTIPAIDPRLAHDFGVFLQSGGLAGLIRILEARPLGTPLETAALEALRRIQADADLFLDVANLTADQRARFAALIRDLNDSSLFTILNSVGEGVIADDAALSAAIGRLAAVEPVPPAIGGSPANRECGVAETPAIVADVNMLTGSSSIFNAVVGVQGQAASAPGDLAQSLRDGDISPSFAALLLSFSDLNALSSTTGATGTFSFGRFISGVVKVAVGVAAVATGVGTAAGLPLAGAGAALIYSGARDVADSFDGQPSCETAGLDFCLADADCRGGDSCFENCCSLSGVVQVLQFGLVQERIIECANDGICESNEFCNSDGCCEEFQIR